MINKLSETYDAIIVGAGISGLVCGCYLAKAGMKVLIAEQHSKPGGYCSSFTRKGFTFDAAAHSFGGYRSGGIMNRILNDLRIADQLQIQRYEPSDVIISADHVTSFWADADKTIRGIQSAFPHEATGIQDFIHYLIQPDPIDIATLRNKSFQNLLDRFFSDNKLKAILSFPVLGNGSLPPSLMSAFSAAKIYSEFILDGGYYPAGGMQSLPDALSKRFKEYGGELLLSSRVEKIDTRDGTVTGVVLQKGRTLATKRVISNCDARQTFTNLLEPSSINKDFMDVLDNMTTSLSIFAMYLGIDGHFKTLPPAGTNTWYLPEYDIEALHKRACEMKGDRLADYYMVRVSPDNKSVLAFVNTAFKDKKYWQRCKTDCLMSLIRRIENTTIPHLSKHIIFQEAASPYTMYRYTLNQAGAAYGWAATPSQFAVPSFRKPQFLKGLFLTGHWTTYAQGVPGVAYLGYDTAKNILKRQPVNT